MTTADLDEINPVTEYLCAIPYGLRREASDELAANCQGASLRASSATTWSALEKVLPFDSPPKLEYHPT